MTKYQSASTQGKKDLLAHSFGGHSPSWWGSHGGVHWQGCAAGTPHIPEDQEQREHPGYNSDIPPAETHLLQLGPTSLKTEPRAGDQTFQPRSRWGTFHVRSTPPLQFLFVSKTASLDLCTVLSVLPAFIQLTATLIHCHLAVVIPQSEYSPALRD